MRLEVADVLCNTAGNTAATDKVRALQHPPVGEPGEVCDNGFVQNS